jgi:hypothetical protein
VAIWSLFLSGRFGFWSPASDTQSLRQRSGTSLSASTADECHDFDFGVVRNYGSRISISFHHDPVDLHRDDARIDFEPFEELEDGDGIGKVVGIAVEDDLHFSWVEGGA